MPVRVQAAAAAAARLDSRPSPRARSTRSSGTHRSRAQTSTRSHARPPAPASPPPPPRRRPPPASPTSPQPPTLPPPPPPPPPPPLPPLSAALPAPSPASVASYLPTQTASRSCRPPSPGSGATLVLLRTSASQPTRAHDPPPPSPQLLPQPARATPPSSVTGDRACCATSRARPRSPRSLARVDGSPAISRDLARELSPELTPSGRRACSPRPPALLRVPLALPRMDPRSPRP